MSRKKNNCVSISCKWSASIARPQTQQRSVLSKNLKMIIPPFPTAYSKARIPANDFQVAQNNTANLPRRSERIRQQTGEWWVAPFSLLSQTILVNEEPTSFKVPTSPENLSFWQPGIERKHGCLIRNNTWIFVDYTSGMKVLPCKYVLKVKNNKRKFDWSHLAVDRCTVC